MIHDLTHSKTALLVINVLGEYFDPDGPAPSTPTSLCTPRRRSLSQPAMTTAIQSHVGFGNAVRCR